MQKSGIILKMAAGSLRNNCRSHAWLHRAGCTVLDIRDVEWRNPLRYDTNDVTGTDTEYADLCPRIEPISKGEILQSWAA
jgi:hypothetical protein